MGILLDKLLAGNDAIDDKAEVLPFWQKKRDQMAALLAIGAGQEQKIFRWLCGHVVLY